MTYEANPFNKSWLARLFDFIDRMAGRGPSYNAPNIGGPLSRLDPTPEEMEARRAAADVPRQKPTPTD